MRILTCYKTNWCKLCRCARLVVQLLMKYLGKKKRKKKKRNIYYESRNKNYKVEVFWQ